MPNTFYTPPGYSGSAQLTASTGLTINAQGRWRFSQQGYNDRITFGLSLGWPDTAYNGEFDYGSPGAQVKPLSGGLLSLSATNWTIPVIGNTLQSYTDPDTLITYPATQCRIQIQGQWQVSRQQNSNSYNSFGVIYDGVTETDLGSRISKPNLLSYNTTYATYTIQGVDVTGGAIDTFSGHEFFCRVTEATSSKNSNNEFQSNTVTSPVFAYTYSMSWEIL